MIVGHWTFDNDAILGADASGLANDATPVDVASERPLHSGPGSAAAFNGTTSYMTVPNAPELRPGSNSFSVEFWYQGSPSGTVIHKTDSWAVWMDGTDLLASITDERSGTAQGVVVALPDFTERSHVVVTFDRGIHQVRASVNGVPAESFDMGELAKIRSAGDIEIGRGPGGYLSGTLDNVVYRLGILSDESIEAIYATGTRYSEYMDFVNMDRPVLNLAFFTPTPEDETLTQLVEDVSYGAYQDEFVSTATGTPVPSPLWETEYSGATLDTGTITVAIPEAKTIEFAVEDDLLPAAYRIVRVYFDDGTSTLLRTAGGQGGIVLSELDALGVQTASTFVGDMGFRHVVITMFDGSSNLTVNGTTTGLTGTPGRTITSIELDSHYIGAMSNLAIYDYHLSDDIIDMHYEIARSGRYILQAVEDTNPPSILNDGFTPYNYDWTVTSA